MLPFAKLLTIVCSALLLLTACQREQPHSDIPPAYFLCGETELRAVYHDGNQLSLAIDGVVYELVSVVSASGAKYETSPNAMPHLTFWNKGRQATLDVDGKTYPICQQVTDPDEEQPAAVAPEAGGDKQSIIGKEWLVEDIAGRGIIDNSHVTLMFTDEGRVAGHSGCNRYGASYELGDDGKLVVHEIVTTLMACAGGEAMMNQEQLFTQTLGKMTEARLNENGFLILSNKDGQTIRLAPGSHE